MRQGSVVLLDAPHRPDERTHRQRLLKDRDDCFGHVLGAHHVGKPRHVGCPAGSHRKLGRRAAWADRAHTNAGLAEFTIESAGQSNLSELRGGVHGFITVPANAGNRRHDDDIAATLLHESRHGSADRPHRAGHVGVHHRLQLLVGRDP